MNECDHVFGHEDVFWDHGDIGGGRLLYESQDHPSYADTPFAYCPLCGSKLSSNKAGDNDETL